MKIRVAFVYPWATFGGCERILLNRALAFKNYHPETLVDFYFLNDSGGLASFSSALSRYELNATTSIVSSLDRDYDLISLIDCPQAINLCVKQRYIVECHTSYAENRRYLGELPLSCQQVVTPSPSFSSVIQKEFPSISIPISELRNFVPWDINPVPHLHNYLPHWCRKPILFFGRLDLLKDPLSLLDAFKLLERRRKGEFLLLFCGPRTPEIDIDKEISKRSLDECSVVLPPIPFASAEALLYSVANAGGLLVSPSKGESFGLSVAEAISSLVPVVLSDIKAHRELVRGYESTFTYPSNNTEQLSLRIESVFDNYKNVHNALENIRPNFSASTFIEDWKNLLGKLGISP